MWLVRELVLILSTACFGGFSLAVPLFFRNAAAISFRMVLLSAMSVAGFVWLVELLLTEPQLVEALWLSGALLAASLGLFCWTVITTRRGTLELACSNGPPKSLQRQGPFGLVRHPLYTSYIVFWSAGAVAVGGGFWTVPLAMTLVYTAIARSEERLFDKTALATSYRTYREETGMFFPHIWARRPRRALSGVP